MPDETPASPKIFDQSVERTPPQPEPAAEPAQAPPRREQHPDTKRFLKDGVTARMVRQAKASGISDADLQEMSADEVHEHLVQHNTDQRVEQIFQRSEKARDRQPSPDGPVTAEKFQHGLTDENAIPEIKAAVDKVVAHFEDRIAALEAKFGPVAQHVETQARQAGESFNRRMERFYAQHPEVYGTHKMTGDKDKDAEFRESPEFYARMQVYAAWKKAGGDMDELETELAKAHAVRFAPKAAPAEPAESDDEVQEWEDGVLGRPSQRGATGEPDGKEKAVQGLKSNPALSGHARKNGRPPRGQYLRHPTT